MKLKNTLAPLIAVILTSVISVSPVAADKKSKKTDGSAVSGEASVPDGAADSAESAVSAELTLDRLLGLPLRDALGAFPELKEIGYDPLYVSWGLEDGSLLLVAQNEEILNGRGGSTIKAVSLYRTPENAPASCQMFGCVIGMPDSEASDKLLEAGLEQKDSCEEEGGRCVVYEAGDGRKLYLHCDGSGAVCTMTLNFPELDGLAILYRS